MARARRAVEPDRAPLPRPRATSRRHRRAPDREPPARVRGHVGGAALGAALHVREQHAHRRGGGRDPRRVRGPCARHVDAPVGRRERRVSIDRGAAPVRARIARRHDLRTAARRLALARRSASQRCRRRRSPTSAKGRRCGSRPVRRDDRRACCGSCPTSPAGTVDEQSLLVRGQVRLRAVDRAPRARAPAPRRADRVLDHGAALRRHRRAHRALRRRSRARRHRAVPRDVQPHRADDVRALPEAPSPTSAPSTTSARSSTCCTAPRRARST